MRHKPPMSSACRNGCVVTGRRLALLVLAMLVAAFVAGPAYGWTAFNWIDSVTMGGASAVGTNGYNPRNYIEDWRSVPSCTTLFYKHTDNSARFSPSDCSNNPYKWQVSDGFAKAYCTVDDGGQSGEDYPFTCQTTKP